MYLSGRKETNKRMKRLTQHNPQYFSPFYHDFVCTCTCKFEKFHKVYENSNEIYLGFFFIYKTYKTDCNLERMQYLTFGIIEP